MEEEIISHDRRLSHLLEESANKRTRAISGKTRIGLIVLGAVIFVCMIMTVAIIIVCLTTPKPKYVCISYFKAVLNGDLFKHDSLPCAVVTDDLNHDNFVDIVVVNSGRHEIGILINLGIETFAPQISIGTGTNARPVSVVLADFNNDTHLDIAVANYDIHNINIFLGYGNGTFFNHTMFATGASRPLSLDVGDFNHDQKIDIIVTNNGTNDLGIYFGKGNGFFDNSIILSTGYDSLPHAVVVNDFNNDHYQDIAVVNYGTDNVGIFLGHGNGSFTTQMTYATGFLSRPYALTAGDLNSDGRLDIVVANSGKNNVGILLGNGDGSFQAQKNYPIPANSNSRSIIVGDFDKDLVWDIAVSAYGTNNIYVLLGYGNGSFAEPTVHFTGIASAPFGIVAGDFNNNNQTDIAVTNYQTNNVYVLIEYRIEQAKYPTTYPTGDGSAPYHVFAADIDNDTHLDLISANMGINNIGVFFGYGNGSFPEQNTFSSGADSRPFAVFVIDIDKDSHLDILTANSNGQRFGILYGSGNRRFEDVVLYPSGTDSALESIIADYFNNDTYLDVAFADFGTNNVGVLLGLGNRTFGPLARYSPGLNSRPYAVTAGDVNNDGIIDLATANYGTSTMAVLLGTGNGSFTFFESYSTGNTASPWMVTMADLNKDNHLEIIVVNKGNSIINIFYGFGNGSFTASYDYSTGATSAVTWVNIADMNNDTWLDLVVANTNGHNVGVFLADGRGSFGEQSTYSLGFASSPSSSTVGDFNEDKRLDVAASNYGLNCIGVLLARPGKSSTNQQVETNSSVLNKMEPILLGEYYAAFRSSINYPTGASSHPYSIAIGDLNNDTIKDIIITNSGNENLGILLGYENGSYIVDSFYTLSIGSSPRYAVIADFNKDNYSDTAVTDARTDTLFILLGNGTGRFSTELRYSTGLGSTPSNLAAGDFNDDSYLDLVVTNGGTDSIGIFFGFDYTTFIRQTPFEAGYGETPFGVSTKDINRDGHVDVICSLHSGSGIAIFLGYGNGSFAPVQIYGRVDASRPYYVDFADFNNDTHIDIAAATWGSDALNVILGYGNGSFGPPVLYPVGGTRPMSVATGDLNNDGRADMVSANYGGDTIGVFLGYGNGSFQPVMTFLAGRGATPTAVFIADLNRDNIPDIISTNQAIHNIGVFIGYGNGSFAVPVTYSTGESSSPWMSKTADFNKDGKLDVVALNYGGKSIAVLFGDGNGHLENRQMYSTGSDSSPIDIEIADFNQDGQLDIVVTDEANSHLGIFFGYHDGTFASISLLSLELGSISYGLAVGDFNSDNQMDIVAGECVLSAIVVFLAHGSKPFGGQTKIFLGEEADPSSVAVGHFNQDTYLDIAVTNTGTDNLLIFFGDGNRNFPTNASFSTGEQSNPVALNVGHVNNDSQSDIIVANAGTNNIAIMLANGNGTFSISKTYSTGDNSLPNSVGLGDFNFDTYLDIGVTNTATNDACAFFGLGDGTYINQTWYSTGYDSRPNYIIFEDLNKDDLVDVAVALYGEDNVLILINIC